jgi:hypothetical protein
MGVLVLLAPSLHRRIAVRDPVVHLKRPRVLRDDNIDEYERDGWMDGWRGERVSVDEQQLSRASSQNLARFTQAA